MIFAGYILLECFQSLLEVGLEGVPGPTREGFQGDYSFGSQLSSPEVGSPIVYPNPQSEGPLPVNLTHSRVAVAFDKLTECFHSLLEGVLQGVPGPTREGFQGGHTLSSQLARLELQTPR